MGILWYPCGVRFHPARADAEKRAHGPSKTDSILLLGLVLIIQDRVTWFNYVDTTLVVFRAKVWISKVSCGVCRCVVGCRLSFISIKGGAAVFFWRLGL